MKHLQTVVLAVLALLCAGNTPTAAGECAGQFAAAEIPAELPALGEGVCPTSDNIGTGPKIIQQDYSVRGRTLADFLAAYRVQLIEKGWSRIEESEAGPVQSLRASHAAGYSVDVVVNAILAMAYPRPSAHGGQPPSFHLKLILRKIPR